MGLACRDDFVGLIDSLGCRTAAEIGIGAGWFSKILLRSKVDKLWLVDSWSWPNDEKNRAAAYEFAESTGGRAEIVEQDCMKWMAGLPDGAIDFVYLDTNHSYQSSKRQIPECWRVAAKVLAGHDYIVWNPWCQCEVGVVLAVEEFARERGLEVHVTGCDGTDFLDRFRVAHMATMLDDHGPWGAKVPSFWLVKPG